MKFEVRISTPDEAVHVLNQISEFDHVYTETFLLQRLAFTDSVILVAYINSKPVGCKIAYDRFQDGTIYSWLGGVVPQFRRQGIAQKLETHLEIWARERAYTSIVFKTRHKHKAMIEFAKKNGYLLIEEIPREKEEELRIVYEKQI